MSLSREIIVLDFGDEATNPYDFDKPKGPPAGGNCKISMLIMINFNIAILSDRLQSGRGELARDQRGDIQLGDRDGHLSHPHLRAGALRGLRPPPRHLHLHHVLLLHEKGEDKHIFIFMSSSSYILVPIQVILQNQKERDCRGSTIFRG